MAQTIDYSDETTPHHPNSSHSDEDEKMTQVNDYSNETIRHNLRGMLSDMAAKARLISQLLPPSLKQSHSPTGLMQTHPNAQQRPMEQPRIANGEYLTPEKLASISRCKTPASFATKLIRAIFTTEELKDATIKGANRHRQLDAKRIAWVQELTLRHKSTKSDGWWRRIRRSVDSSLRFYSKMEKMKLKKKKRKRMTKKVKKKKSLSLMESFLSAPRKQRKNPLFGLQ